MAVLNSDTILSLGVDQPQYDSISLNRKSTFINLFNDEEEFVVSVNTLEMKQGGDFLFLSEVLRAAELNNLAPLNSLATYKGLTFRLAAVQTSELQSGLKRNVAKKEDFQKKSPPAQPAQNQAQQPIQNQPRF